MVMRFLLSGISLLFVGIILIGFSGHYVPAGDSAAILRPIITLILLPIAAMLWWNKARRLSIASCLTALVALISLAPGYFAPSSTCNTPCLKLYQKNLLGIAWPRYELAADILASEAAIVTLQEDSAHNRQFMADLFAHYPSSVTCPFRPDQKVALLTNLPVVEGSAFCLKGKGVAGIRILPPNSPPIWALSVHLQWPYPFDQYHQSRHIAEHLATLEGPFLIAGDFNMVPWGASVSRISDAAGNQHLGRFLNTYQLGNTLVPLPIDMVLVPDNADGNITLRPFLGSDHRGVLAEINLR